MRDVARMREKIELRLDNRQVVGLVLGAAVVLGIVFYLGVGVGRHLGAAAPVVKPDPLAHLDERALVDAALTFADTLTAEGKAVPSPAPPPVAAPAIPTAPVTAPTVPTAPAAAPVVDTGPAAGRDVAAVAAPAAAPAQAPIPAPSSEPAVAEPPPAKPLPSAAEALAAVDARTAGKAEPAPAAASDSFTVQAAAMPSRPEAEAFAAKLRQRGLSPYVIEADVPGKGTFFRVRLGRFQTREAADRYLQDFKRETGLSGFVTTTGK